MKVKASDEATSCIVRRKAFRWMGVRGMRSRTAEGCYGVFVRKQQSSRNYRLTLLMTVYEPQTARWYTTSGMLNELHANRLSLPPDNFQCVDSDVVLDAVYRGGYTVLARARLLGDI